MSSLTKDSLPKVGIAATLRSLIALVFKVDKAYLAVILLRAVLGAANGLINLVLPRLLIDGFAQGFDWAAFARGILLFALAKYIVLSMVSVLKRQNDLHSEQLHREVPMVFAGKAMRLPYRMLEDPAILDLKERAIFPITNYWALQGLIDDSLDMLTGILTLGGLAALLFSFSPLLLIALLILCAIASLLSARFMKYMRVQQQELIPTNRKYGYWANVTGQSVHQKEIRLYGLDHAMNSKIADYTDEIMDWLRIMYRRQGNNEALQMMITTLMRVMAYGYGALRVLGTTLGAQITLGDYSVLIMATENFFSTFTRAFGGVFEVMTSLHHLLPFAQFMALPEEQAKDGKAPEPLRSLAFENLSFAYPGSEKLILNNLSFEIKEGEKISIVGLNNAGKSTMVKLICRLFEPTAGRILWNGTDIREYDHHAYLAQLSCVFQDFHLFPFTIRDNIDPAGEGTEQGIQAVLAEAGIWEAVSSREQGIDTYLNKSIWEEATEFSGGEQQKLAIARSLYRESSLVILDEPTASLDPLAESEVYERFHQLTRGRTTIFISHRMSSSTFCDRILLLQDGQIAAFDSHANLMRGHNQYRELFLAQAEHFRETAV